MKPPTLTWAIGTLVQDEEQKEKERNREWASNPATLDSLGASYDQQGSHDEPILLTLWSTGGTP